MVVVSLPFLKKKTFKANEREAVFIDDGKADAGGHAQPVASKHQPSPVWVFFPRAERGRLAFRLSRQSRYGCKLASGSAEPQNSSVGGDDDT